MTLVERVHGGYVHARRIRVLSDHLAGLAPTQASMLDVGCGDGLLSYLITQKRRDVSMQGLEIRARRQTHIPVGTFDGHVLPAEDKSFDVVMFVDVLHHTENPLTLLREATRVARDAILIKDHTCDGPLARPTLKFMDRVGNARHGVPLPYNYWSKRQWLEAFDLLGLIVRVWKARLGLYPAPFDSVFGRSLHFIARVEFV